MPVILPDGIIQNYLAGLHLRQQQEHTKFQEGQQKEEGARAQEQLKGYLAHLKAEEAHQQGQLDIQKQTLASQKAQHEFNMQQQVAKMTSAGEYDPSGQGGQVQQQQNFSPINQPQIPPSAISSPVGGTDLGNGQVFDPRKMVSYDVLAKRKQDEARIAGQIHAQTAGATTTAVQEAEEPFDISKATRSSEAALKLAEQKNKEAIELQKIKDAEALKRTQATVEGRRLAANISASARRYVADKAHAVNPDEVTNNAILHMTGQGGTPLGNTPRDNATKLIISQMGGVDFDKKDATKLKEVHALDPLYDKMRAFIGNLPDSKPGALVDKLVSRISVGDLNNFKAEITGVSGNIAKTMGGESGRLSEQDIARAVGLLVVPGITKKQAIDRITYFEQNTRSKVMDQVLGGQNDRQKLLNLITYEHDPAKFNKPVEIGGKQFAKKDGTPHMLFEKDPSDGEWLVFNPKTKSYVSVDHGK